jgi:hypothetical protein
VPLKETRDGGPGLDTHACKTRWHKGGLVGEQGYEAEEANSLACPHLSGRRIPMVCTSLISHHGNGNQGTSKEEISRRLAGLTRGIAHLAFCLAATFDRQIGHGLNHMQLLYLLHVRPSATTHRNCRPLSVSAWGQGTCIGGTGTYKTPYR